MVWKSCGIYEQVPKEVSPDALWVYKESVFLGNTIFSKEEVRCIVRSISPNWGKNSYHILTKNCNHFTDTLSTALVGCGIPTWVNRLAGIGCTVVSGIRSGDIPSHEELMSLTLFTDLPTTPVNLRSWIDPFLSQALNEDLFYPLKFVLFEKKSTSYLQSNVGPELFIYVTFTRPCAIDHILIEGTPDHPDMAPQLLRIFANSRDFLNLNAVNSNMFHLMVSITDTETYYHTSDSSTTRHGGGGGGGGGSGGDSGGDSGGGVSGGMRSSGGPLPCSGPISTNRNSGISCPPDYGTCSCSRPGPGSSGLMQSSNGPSFNPCPSPVFSRVTWNKKNMEKKIHLNACGAPESPFYGINTLGIHVKNNFGNTKLTRIGTLEIVGTPLPNKK
eukprot:TRINITY_DN2293_c0_g2_i1.p1 TRINITY_DN2293_c0_g2~~TRINITY_DN2293_c0_g2_i1.p1  ORF type:complete len:387 (+),score=84.73 TRINITY_DN2293_c0_g2_i1:343-1503(+)